MVLHKYIFSSLPDGDKGKHCLLMKNNIIYYDWDHNNTYYVSYVIRKNIEHFLNKLIYCTLVSEGLYAITNDYPEKFLSLKRKNELNIYSILRGLYLILKK